MIEWIGRKWNYKLVSIFSTEFKLQNASEEDSSDSDQNNEKNDGSSSSSSSERYVKLKFFPRYLI